MISDYNVIIRTLNESDSENKKFPILDIDPVSGDGVIICDFCVHEYPCDQCVYGDRI